MHLCKQIAYFKEVSKRTLPIERRPEVIVPVLVVLGPGDHARVHEGGQTEVGDDEHGDDGLEERHLPETLVKEIPLNAGIVKEEERGRQEQRPGERRRQKLCLVRRHFKAFMTFSPFFVSALLHDGEKK